MYLGKNEKSSISDYEVDVSITLGRCPADKYGHLMYYLPAGNDLGVVDVAQRYASVDVYMKTLDLFRAGYHTVIVDAETHVHLPTTAAALARADLVVVPLANGSEKSRYEIYKKLSDAEFVFCQV